MTNHMMIIKMKNNNKIITLSEQVNKQSNGKIVAKSKPTTQMHDTAHCPRLVQVLRQQMMRGLN